MIFLRATLSRSVLLLLGLALSGCYPASQSSLDEQKDPHFLTGRARKTAMDYNGAVEAFETALEANPSSASAHFELGLLHYENSHDWAAAIYHFEKYLRLQPKSNKSDVIKQFIAACKQELVKGVPLGPVNDQVKRELEKLLLEKESLARDNAELLLQLEQLKAQYVQRRAPAATNFSNPSLRSPAPGQANATPPSTEASERPVSPPIARAGLPSASARTHVVKAGDTPYSIARTYGVRLTSLLSANPAVDSRRLRPGQTLTIPAQ